MADIQAYLDAIENAVYGEDVRGSIHDAIKIINEVGEVVITAGTTVTSPSSSTEGFFENSLYFNTNTNDLWQCNGSGWTLLGNLKGDQGDQGNPGQAATIAVGTVTKGDNASVVNSGTSSDAVFDFVLPKGDPGVNTWGSITGDIKNQTDLADALDAKQDTLTFDDAPTANSNNPVKSKGIKTALDGKQNALGLYIEDGYICQSISS